ncbi:Actin/actin-like protein [Testicularia cyperi]|uniref:Actin/actin-like protein n=1 Tax=Testicularia cyperi TaxID=1882483 RepID=A0A317XXG8_9BASI|nr:Actin/actin-like protein [Testicularia cyperi]
MPGVYGGDEINALVIDPGHSSTRAGWAGEDTPRVVAPSSYGYLPITDDEIATLDADAAFTAGSSNANGNGAAAAAGDDDDEQMKDADAAATSASEANGSAAPTEEASDLRLKQNRARAAQKSLRFMVDRQNKRRRYVGDNDLNLYRKGLEIVSIFDEDGVVSDQGAFSSLCGYALDQLSCDPRQHPLLLTEPAWNSKESREALTELAFETLETPAFYLANRSVLSSFAAGKPTSLVIDIGSSSVSSIPIVDGFILRKGIQRQNNAGEAINRALLYSLHHERGAEAGGASASDSAAQPAAEGASATAATGASSSSSSSGFAGVTPQYLIKSRSPVDPNAAPSAVLRQDRVSGSTESYRAYHVSRTLNDFKESVAQVLEMPWDEQQAQFRSGRMYEFPDGYNDAFGIERLKAPEILFTPSLWNDKTLSASLSSSSSASAGVSRTSILTPARSYSGLTQMVMNSINNVDVDSRPQLFSNIVVVGGSSFIPGLVDRLSYELGIHAPNQKVKIHSPGNTTERRHSSWLGGSILASLGTFHQLWISKQEYEEHGAAIVHARCK